MQISKTVGIDLGTTNSVIAILDSADTALITGIDDQGRALFPSVVGWHPEQRRIVAGQAATAASDGSGAVPLSSIKRSMGLNRRFAVGAESLSPEEASACILRGLRDLLERKMVEPRQLLDRAVITMPAYFNHDQIEATRRAGELAGFEVVELLHEPTAAAIYYSRVENHCAATYLVYDLGGGTFDVSIIRRRLGDCEVLGVSGDPFLGGDDFDRLLASRILDEGVWTGSEANDSNSLRESVKLLCDPSTPSGSVNFARLARIAAGIKIQLSDADRVDRFIPNLLRDRTGRDVSLETSVDRSTFERLIKDSVDRTIDCCHEALARARERAGIGLSDIDYVILVGGSSRIPLVRRTVQAAFCNAALAEHVRCPEPLLHEPDLCVAYGAAIRAANYGTRYRFPVCSGGASELEMNLTSPTCFPALQHVMTGVVRFVTGRPRDSNAAAPAEIDGFSVRVRSVLSGLVDEAFLDERGSFAVSLELQPEIDNAFEITLCDGAGVELATTTTTVRQRAGAQILEPGLLSTQLIAKPLQIELLDSTGNRVKQVVAPVGAPLPGIFRCICRTRDQTGRVVVPLYEENRVIHQLEIDNLDSDLPPGTPVDVELAVDVKHVITVSVRVHGTSGGRHETATVAAAPAAEMPTRSQMQEVQKRLNEILESLVGGIRTRLRARANQAIADLEEALRYADEPKAIVRMAELRSLLQQAETARGQTLDPPWPQFALLVRRCLDLAAEVADKTGREREELFEHIRAQERYAEPARAEANQALYRECWQNLEKYAAYLEGLSNDSLPRPAARRTLPPEEEARESLDRFRSYLSSVWKEARDKDRRDLDTRLRELAKQASGLSARVKSEPIEVVRTVRRLANEIAKVEADLAGRHREDGDNAGLLEGAS
jgi:molecular chaperone DnaK